MWTIHKSVLSFFSLWLCIYLCSHYCWCDNDAAVVVDEEEHENIETLPDDHKDDGPIKVSLNHGGNSDGEPFIATNEWQTVKKDQSVPKGLHVRMNLQTNTVEAKLLSDDDETKQDNAREERKQQMIDISKSAEAMNSASESSQMRLSRQEIKDVLKNLKHDQDDVQDEKIREESLKKKFRSMDELREDMKKMEMGVRTDFQIISELWNEYISDDVTEQRQVHLLEQLEYYLHQFDNARDFAQTLDGFKVLSRSLNSTNEDIRREVALVVASAVQSNPAVQIKAIEVGLMHQLIWRLSVEKTLTVKSRLLAAIASLIRHFPYAQRKFVESGGVSALSDLFTGELPLGREKLQVKAVTLVGDLLKEMMDCENQQRQMTLDMTELEKNQEKLNQYQEVGLSNALRSGKWCTWIPGLLSLPEHDSREKVLTTMTNLMDNCQAQFHYHIPQLETLKLEYAALAKSESNDGDDYYSSMERMIGRLILTLQEKRHVEL